MLVGARHEHDHGRAAALGERDPRAARPPPSPRVTPGTTSNAMPAARTASISSASRPKTTGIAALEPDDAARRRRARSTSSQLIWPWPTQRRPGALPTSMSVGARAAPRRATAAGASRSCRTTSASRSRREPLQGDELGIARPGADERRPRPRITTSLLSPLAAREETDQAAPAPRAARRTARPPGSAGRREDRVPPRPPTKTCTPSTILPSTFTLQPCRPTSAVWWLPHEAGQPDQRTVIGRVAPSRCSNSRASAIARVLVSMRARLQKSVPVHDDEAALDLGGVVGQRAQQRLLRSGRPGACRGRAESGRSATGVRRSSPAPVRLGQARQLQELVAGDPADRRLEPDVAQARLPLAKDADVIGASSRRARRARPAAAARPSRASSSARNRPRPTRRPGRPAALAPRLARAVVAEDQRDRRRRPPPPPRAARRRRARARRRSARALLAADGEVEAGDLIASTRDRRRHRDVLGLAAACSGRGSR